MPTGPPGTRASGRTSSPAWTVWRRLTTAPSIRCSRTFSLRMWTSSLPASIAGAILPTAPTTARPAVPSSSPVSPSRTRAGASSTAGASSSPPMTCTRKWPRTTWAMSRTSVWPPRCWNMATCSRTSVKTACSGPLPMSSPASRSTSSCSRSLRPIRRARVICWTMRTGLAPSSTGRSSALRTACCSVRRPTSSPATAPPPRRTST